MFMWMYLYMCANLTLHAWQRITWLILILIHVFSCFLSHIFVTNQTWKRPTPTTNVTSSSKRRGKRPQQVSSFPSVPPCPCGAKREFEFQLMPSILHVLNVDKYATIGNRIDLPTSRNEKDEILGTFSSGGMNWGTIAVYSCSVSCGEFREEYVVVQESVDGDPKRMDMKVISNKNGNGNKDLDSDINY